MNKWDESLLPIDFVGHDVVEIVSSHETIIIKIGLNEDLIQILIVQILTQIMSDFLQLSNTDLSLI